MISKKQTNFLYKESSEKSYYSLKGVFYYSFLDNNISHYSASCLIGNKLYYFDDNYIKVIKNTLNITVAISLFYEKKIK